MVYLPYPQQSEILPKNTNAELLRTWKRLCMILGNIQLCWRSGIDAKIPGQFQRGTFGTDAKQSCGEVDHIPGGVASEAVVPRVQLQAGVVIVVEWT